MHIPGHMVSEPVAWTTMALGFSAVGISAAKALKDPIKPERFASATALIFAAQMLNFPVVNGTSGHLIGGVLAASLLGTSWGILSVTTVLIVQSVLFGDGGLSALGANVINMAVIGAGCGGWLKRKLDPHLSGFPATALSSWISVLAASLLCSLQVAASGFAAYSQIIPAMLGVHALIGLGEAAITIGCLLLLNRKQRPADLSAVWTAAVIMACLSPWASAWPDGFEAVMGRLNAAALDAGSASMAFFADYRVAFVSHEMMSTVLAGLIGVATVYFAGRSLALFLKEARV